MSNSELLPCEVNASVKCTTCELNNTGCPIKTPYNVLKAVYPIKTTAKPGVNIRELVKAQYPDYCKYFDKHLDWDDLDGILDFLYFHAKILNVPEAQRIIDLIESNCEVQK